MPFTDKEKEQLNRMEKRTKGQKRRVLASDEVRLDMDRVEERVTVRLSRCDTRKIDAICKDLGIGRSTFLRMAAKQALQDRLIVQNNRS